MNRQFLFVLIVAVMVLSGCSWFDGETMHSHSPEEELELPHTRLTGDIVVPLDLNSFRVESIGLVTGLHGTGSDPAPSPQRQALMDEMQTRGVENPNTILASNNCALVLVRAYLRPGIQKGDRFDVEVRVPSGSETTSLRGGYLLETRLRELAALGGQIHEGRTYGLAHGPVLVDPSADAKDDRILACRGRILGGGVALQSRPVLLVLTPGNQNVMNSSRVANAINHRFHSFQNGLKTGVAKAIKDDCINLNVHPRYKDNVIRYLQVVRSLPLRESSAERKERIGTLEKMLQSPDTAAGAALQLEAIGSEGIPPLLKALDSEEPVVRFYAAEALAYLDRHEAARPLGELARRHPAFRVFALTALSAMQDFAAAEQLRAMLSSDSAETRYGAFRALTAMTTSDPMVCGENLGEGFSYHVLEVDGPPMIHITRSRRAELVLFGRNQHFQTPLAVNAGERIMVTSVSPTEISVSKYVVGEADQKRRVSTSVDEVVRAIVELGGTYPDVVQALQEAKASGGLPSRFEVDALPMAGRTYKQFAEAGADTGEGAESNKVQLAGPTPDLFTKKPGSSHQKEGSVADKTDSEGQKSEKTPLKTPKNRSFFGRSTPSASNG